MNNAKINNLKDNVSGCNAKKISSEKELHNSKQNRTEMKFKKNERPNSDFTYWDLSGGLLGI